MIDARTGHRGQAVVLFALCLVAIIAMAGLLVDGGLAWSNQRQAQAAADTSALTAAQAASEGDTWTVVKSKARSIAQDNDFDKDLVDCDGTDRPDQGVVVNRPPASGPNAGDDGFVEVVATRTMRTAFAGAIGMNCVQVSARAVASIAGSAATCNFCAISTSARDHVFLVDSQADVRVDGDVYVNGTSGSVPCDPGAFRVCGDAFDFDGDRDGDGGGDGDGRDRDHMSAKSIAVTGGWETDSASVVEADRLADTCPFHLEPQGYASLSPAPVANVCIGVPALVDPLNDPAHPGDVINPPLSSTKVPQALVNGCLADSGTVLRIPTGTLANPEKLVLDGSRSYTICPGTYYGGISITDDSTRVTMLPGVYFIAGGGFSATNGASIDGSTGVMIYNTGEFEAFNSSTSPGLDLVPACDATAPSACVVPDVTGSNGLSSSAAEVFPGQPVTFTFTVEGTATAGAPTGTMTFFDGKDVIAGCGDVAVTPGAGQTASATCPTSYPIFGTRAISAVYVDASCRTAPECVGDAQYSPVGADLDPPLLVKAQAEGGIQDIDIQTGGQVLLHAPTSGPYSGLLIFQDRSRGADVRISPGSGLGSCSSGFMSARVSGITGSAPAPCGQLGGLSGTIYAPHQGSGTNGSSTVSITGSGLADLQVIAAQIDVSADSNVRFAYRPEAFANGKIHLVE